MSFLYVGNANNVTPDNIFQTSLPQDGIDQASAITVDTPFRLILDELAKMGEFVANKRPDISCYCVNADLTTIFISPLPKMLVFNGTKWIYTSNNAESAVTVAQLEGGGNFIPGNFYYIYVKSLDGTPTYVISINGPDTNGIFKNSLALNPTQFRYLCSIVAATATTTYSFRMVNYNYIFSPPKENSISTSNFQPPFGTDVTFASGFPLSAKMGLFRVKLLNTGAGGFYFGITYGPGTVYKKASYPGLFVPPASTDRYIDIEVPILNGGVNASIFDPSGGAVNTDSGIRIWPAGYKE